VHAQLLPMLPLIRQVCWVFACLTLICPRATTPSWKLALELCSSAVVSVICQTQQELGKQLVASLKPSSQ
jgi:hypothetical protein